MRRFFLTTTVLMSLLTLLLSTAHAQNSARNPSVYNLQNQMALKGFDPVAVFPEGGGTPTPGKAELRLDYMGVVYLFARAENLDLFVQNPDKYEPTYGGWCAYAMASGTKVDIQPQLFTLHGNRAHYFVSQRAKQNFDRDVRGHEERADQFWKQISGEDPRF
ncbi:MAG: hypothetical protein KF681_07395 [Bdellovibrionaceae bacterium]|nr:hypothetical protein [Pseudobdellovibrionaceae bacterium]